MTTLKRTHRIQTAIWHFQCGILAGLTLFLSFGPETGSLQGPTGGNCQDTLQEIVVEGPNHDVCEGCPGVILLSVDLWNGVCW